MTHATTVVIVLNWNGPAGTIQCVDSLGRPTYDWTSHGARERTEPRLYRKKQRRPPIPSGPGRSYVWLLNNDVTADPASLSCLVRAAEATDPIALLSPEISDATAVVYRAGTVPDLAQLQFVDVVEAKKKGGTVSAGPPLLLPEPDY